MAGKPLDGCCSRIVKQRRLDVQIAVLADVARRAAGASGFECAARGECSRWPGPCAWRPSAPDGRPVSSVTSSGAPSPGETPSGGLEQEYLYCEVGIDVILAHERNHLAIDLPLDDSYEVVTHGGLIVVADLQDAVGVAVVDERALPRGERVGEQDGHHALVDSGLRLRRSSTGVLAKYLDC